MDKYSKIEIGSTFGDWMVVGTVQAYRNKGLAYECTCKAQHVRIIEPAEIRRCHEFKMRCQKCRSDGKRESLSILQEKRELRCGPHRALSIIWNAMRSRCERPSNLAWKDYGGRGIRISDEWVDFQTFKKWAMNNGYSSGLTLDRRDNDGPYSPENCRFVTRIVNNNNKRNNIVVTAFGETKTVSEWTRDDRCSVTRKGLQYRLLQGWSPEVAISQAKRR